MNDSKSGLFSRGCVVMKYGAMFHHFHDNVNHLKTQGTISAIEFNLIVDFLETHYNLLTPDQYLSKINNNQIKCNDACLTFDDGPKSQFDVVYPELKKRGLKAFFFVYSGAFSDNPPPLEFFRDFRLNYFGDVDNYYEIFFNTIYSKFNNDYNYFLKAYPQDYLAAYPFYTDNDRRYRFLRDIVLKDKYFDVVFNMMDDIGYSQIERKQHVHMSVDNLKTLNNQGHVIGLHSDTHVTQIQQLSYQEQLEEYTRNYEFVESITNDKILSMSHPCGNYNADTLKVLKHLGLQLGFRSSLVPPRINSSLEVPREDHANILRYLQKNK